MPGLKNIQKGFCIFYLLPNKELAYEVKQVVSLRGSIYLFASFVINKWLINTQKCLKKAVWLHMLNLMQKNFRFRSELDIKAIRKRIQM